MALPTSDISTAVVRNLLGEGGDDFLTLDASTLINMWSRFKPTRGVHTGAADMNNDTFWKGHDGRCGFNLPVLQGAGGAFSPANWEYLHPRGGEPGGAISGYDEPGRLDDFRGYEYSLSVTLPPFYSFIGAGGSVVPANLDPVESNIEA
jgi:hypothetical protein